MSFLTKDGGVLTAKIADGGVTTAKLADGSVTNAKLAAKTVASTAPAGGVAKSAPQTFTITNNGFSPGATPFTVTLTTTGRPVALEFVGSNDPNTDGISTLFSSGNNEFTVEIKRDGTLIHAAGASVGTGASGIILPPGAFNAMDFGASAASHTYTVEMRVASTSVAVTNVCLVAREI